MNTKAETHKRSLGPKPGHLNPQPSPGYARIQMYCIVQDTVCRAKNPLSIPMCVGICAGVRHKSICMLYNIINMKYGAMKCI